MNRGLLLCLVAACSSTPSQSTPVLSDLALATTVAAGTSLSAQFTINNAAGMSGLTLQSDIVEAGGYKSSSSTPLATGGPASETQAVGAVQVSIPTSAPTGTWTVSITVTDGTEVSNALTGSFTVTP